MPKNPTSTKKKNENKSPDIVFQRPTLSLTVTETNNKKIEHMEVNNGNQEIPPHAVNSQLINSQQNIRIYQQINYPQKTLHRNVISTRMHEIIRNTEYKILFYLTANESTIKDRIEMAEEWSKKFYQSNDIILKTKIGYLLKTNKDKKEVVEALEDMMKKKIITKFNETKPYNKPKERNEPQKTFSVVIAGIEIVYYIPRD